MTAVAGVPPQAPSTRSGLALPIDIIGPAPLTGSGGVLTAESARPEDSTKVPGEEAEPAPMLPPEIEMSEEQEARFRTYVENELSLADSERWPYMSKMARLAEKYKAAFPDFPKDWPIANSSQITIPIIKIAVNTLAARIFQTLMAAEPLASIRTEDTNFQDFAFDYEKFLELYGEERLDLGAILDSWTTEIIMLGTGVLESTTSLQRRAGMIFDEASGDYRKKTEDLFAGPIIYHVPLADFWIRAGYTDPQRAPWCGKEVRLTWTQIKDMALSGELNPDQIDRIWKYVPGGVDDAPQLVAKEEELSKFTPNGRTTYRLYELAIRWDTDGDGLEEEVIVYYHRPSRTFLRKKYSGFKQRPWRVARFTPIPHCFYGEGLAEMLEHMQEEISTMHNQRIDNATIANLKIILVARAIQGLRPGDRLWSGKIVRVTDVAKDVGELRLGDIYPSTVMNENITKGYADQLSGIGETAAGTARPISRTTATAQLALLEELNRRFDKVVKGMRRTLGYVFRDVTDLFMISGTSGLAEEWLGDVRGGRLESFLQLPEDVLRRKVKIQVKSTRATVNREVEFQSQIAVFQLIIQLWQQVSTMAQQLAPQTLPVLAHEILAAVTPVFKKVMQYADAPDPDQAISVLTVLERLLPAPENMGGMGSAQADQTQALLEELAARARGLGGGGGGAQETPGQPGLPASPQPLSGPGGPSGMGLVPGAGQPGVSQ